MVASSLGHGSFEMTAKHYAQPEAVSGAKTQRVADLLELDSRPEPMRSADPGEAQAEDLLAQLSPATLQKLLESGNGPRGRASVTQMLAGEPGGGVGVDAEGGTLVPDCPLEPTWHRRRLHF